jgi:hypothetical protein
MITHQLVSEKLLAFLDDRISLNQIITWAESVIADGNYTPDSNIHLLVGIVMSLAGADRPRSLIKRDARTALMRRPMPVDAA